MTLSDLFATVELLIKLTVDNCHFTLASMLLEFLQDNYNYKLEGHSVERMHLRQRLKSENWASLTPRSFATVRRTVVQKSQPDPGNSLALGLQRGLNSISLQCIP